ncbi:RNA-directed DNA polymerase (Reverse transcriptase), Ribonuclease H-like protein [Gossypium australe]|uniref:RNA-directed DNA polymerase (Reverse transcriptase), Ribonuclease H-like protein n=1 Tax=Gossypium australe TaxID=47621 RepID=A0A5B6WGK4_9ROSI|nr:RNA-directed DNA polymerase (Reverse transcriptase), Ribonuclease H-like protein [Gossypium australe]
MTFPHISQTFVSGRIIHPEIGLLENPHIIAIHVEGIEQRNLLSIRPYEPGSILNNWTAEELPVVFRDYTESLDINDMSNDTTDLEVHFEQDMCLEESQDFEGDRDCDLSPDLLRMVKQEEKQILPHEEEVENIALEEGKVVKIGTRIAKETKQDLVELLQEFKDVFAWSYQDMPGLSTNIEKFKKQFDAGFLQVVKYSEWVAHIVPVPKKDGKIKMCVDYKDLNKASSNDNFPLPHIDTLVDNTAGYSLFSFMDGFSGYNQIKMHPEDMKKTTFITLWGTFVIRLRKFQLKLNPTKCTFGARSGKLLGFIVSERGIEVDSNKVKAIQKLPPSRTQKEVRGFLGRLNYIARFISQLTEKCDPIFRLLKKHNQGVWDEECQRAFDKVKRYLSNAPVLSPPNPDRPLILYLSVFNNSMGFYVNQKVIKGSAVAGFLASRALEDYKPLSFDFPNEELMYVANTEECPWKLNFDGASNAVGNGIGAILVSPSGDYYPFTCRLDFDCTNNMMEYEACIMGIQAAAERLIEEFDEITFNYLPRDENQMADALATLASMIKINRPDDMRPIQMSIFEVPAHCYNMEEKEKDDHHWYQEVL